MYPQFTTTKLNALTTSTFIPSEAFLLHYACNLMWKVNNLKAIFPFGFILKNQCISRIWLPFRSTYIFCFINAFFTNLGIFMEAGKYKCCSRFFLYKKYPNKLGRIAPLIFWFADWSEKELIIKTTDFQNHLSYLFQ